MAKKSAILKNQRRKELVAKYAGRREPGQGRGHVSVEAKVTFEDGQEGRISADLKIRDVAASAEPLRQAS